jgi:hypothetical protein
MVLPLSRNASIASWTVKKTSWFSPALIVRGKYWSAGVQA